MSRIFAAYSVMVKKIKNNLFYSGNHGAKNRTWLYLTHLYHLILKIENASHTMNNNDPAIFNILVLIIFFHHKERKEGDAI